MADCLSRWAYRAKALMDISMHCDAEETAEAKRIIESEAEAKCFVVMGSRAELAQVANEGGGHRTSH